MILLAIRGVSPTHQAACRKGRLIHAPASTPFRNSIVMAAVMTRSIRCRSSGRVAAFRRPASHEEHHNGSYATVRFGPRPSEVGRSATVG